VDEDLRSEDLHVYVHWPFCRAKCPYCDFNSHVDDAVDAARWCRAIARELATFAAETSGRRIGSIFFGGGTPSLMDPAHVAAIIEAVRALWPVAADCEITLEANPTSSEAGRFRAFRDAGVNRLSIGVQSFDDAVLRFLGRTHSAGDGQRAVETALSVFARVSFDLIYAVPGQSAQDWARQLAFALDLPVRHLSLYQLTIAKGTPFHRRGIAEADADLGAALFETTQDILGRAGLPAYEISNHATPGGECRHNLAIWRGADYLPVGPGAEGRLSVGGRTEALSLHRLPQRWLDAVESSGHGLARRDVLTPEQRRSELVILGLRLAEGVKRSAFRRHGGADLDAALDREGLGRMRDAGLIACTDEGIRATPAGRQRLDWMLPRLLA
jgi:putative oxygen-independent coproporphyrinogen III oxidase